MIIGGVTDYWNSCTDQSESRSHFSNICRSDNEI